MRSTWMKGSQLALALLLGGALSAGEAWAAGPRGIDLRADGTSSMGATNTASGDMRGRGLGSGMYSAAITVGSDVLGGCTDAAGVVTFSKSNGDTLVLDTSGLLCDTGLSGAGTILTPNEVYNGGFAVDGAVSTGSRFAGTRGTGSVQINFGGDGNAAVGGAGTLISP